MPVSLLPQKTFLTWITVALVGTITLGFVMSTYTDAAAPYPDAFTTTASLVAQWLLARKKLESWYFWIAVDVVAIGVYFSKSLFFTTGLYTLFLGLATMGFFAWRNSFRMQAMEGATT
jgi:nicotinamide mononucleotide transporter